MSLLPCSRYRKTPEPDFGAAVQKIRAAVQRGLPGAQGVSRYRKVGVLMMHWSNDDMGIVPLETELATVFAKVYNFAVETYVIPATPPPRPPLNVIFNRRLKDFVRRYDGPHSLMIYVYSGHANAGQWPYAECNWYGSSADPNSPQLDWLSQRSVADNAEGDALFILDCCYATPAAIPKTENEYLVAAAAMENIAGSSAIQTSFTRRLIDRLVANNGIPQTVASIHASMISNMKVTNTAMEKTPIHIAANTKPTVILQRLARTPKDVQKVQQFGTRGAGKVLISVSLRGQANLPDVRAFEKWLSSHIPPNVASVKVEAALQSTSHHIVLFTVPHEVWPYLDRNEGFQFIDYVDSHNLILLPDSRVGDEAERTLPFRPSSAGH